MDSDDDLFGTDSDEAEETFEITVLDEGVPQQIKKPRKKPLSKSAKKFKAARKRFQEIERQRRDMISSTCSGRRDFSTGNSKSVDQARKRANLSGGHPYNTIGYGNVSQLFKQRKERLKTYNEEISRHATMDHMLVQDYHEKHSRYISFDASQSIPDFYVNKTKLCCMWCTEPCNTIPVPIPKCYHTRSESYKVFGQCCSINCCLAYCRKSRVKESLVRSMFSVIFDIAVSIDITPAPPPMILKKYGGVYDIKQYRQTFLLDISFEENAMPVVPFFHGLVEREKVVNRTYFWGKDEKIATLVNKSVVDATDYRNFQRWNTYTESNSEKNNEKKKGPIKRKRKPQPKKAPTVEQQLSWTHSRMEKQMQDNDLQMKPDKKTLTMMDFVKIRKEV